MKLSERSKKSWEKFKGFFRERQPKHMMNTWQSILFQLVFSFFLYFCIEAASRHSIAEAFAFAVNSTKVFCYNALLIFTTSLFALLFPKRNFFRVLIFGLWGALGIANSIILANRVTPFTGPDLKNISEGGAVITKYLNSFQIALVVILVAAGILFLVRYAFTCPKYRGKKHYPAVIIGLAACCAGMWGLTKYCINERILTTYFGNVAYAYEDYGFPYCFTVTVFDTGIDKPNNYSQELMDTIVNEDSSHEETSIADEDKPNIIIVQLETFMDPTRLNGLSFNEDPLPNWHKLCQQYSSGLYTVPVVGAGTANTEFETLTGMSMRFFGAGEYPFKSVVNKEVCESSAYDLRNIGYHAFALHDNEANFYSRKVVYKNLGFEAFVSKEYMQNQDDTNENGWMRDRNLIQPINDCLDSTSGSDYVFTVSVQPHGAYPTEEVLEDPEITVSGAESDQKKYAWEYYVNQLYEEDQFVQDLIDSVNSRGEPTVILFYGDHLPTMGLEDSDLSSGTIYQTNYLLWDNIGLERKTDTIAAYQAVAEIMDRLNIHEGTMFKFQQANDGTEDDYLANLQALQYDILYGNRYVYHDDGNTPYEPYSFYHLGINRIYITDTQKISDGLYYIYGKNFTQSCLVYVNGTQASTTYINDDTLIVQSDDLDDYAELQIGVQSASSTHRILSWSVKYQKEEPPTASPSPSASASASASAESEKDEE